MGLVIGLTGSIASGKSTVAKLFRERAIPVIDADQIAREIVKPGAPAHQQITATFGQAMLLADQTLNRERLGQLIFTDAEARAQLDAIMHPAITTQMIQMRDDHLASGAPLVVLDIPLLFENELTDIVDQTLVVYVDEITQRNRLMNRDQITRAQAQQRIASQLPVATKKRRADHVIDNNGSIQETQQQFNALLQMWRQEA